MHGGSGRAHPYCCCRVVDSLPRRSLQWRMLRSSTDSQPEGCSRANTLEALTFWPQCPAAASPSMSRSHRRSSQPFNNAPSSCTSRRNPTLIAKDPARWVRSIRAVSSSASRLALLATSFLRHFSFLIFLTEPTRLSPREAVDASGL
jgi:hypothetical protein